MLLSDFDYPLPDDAIAQTPTDPRDHSRLMRLDRMTGAITHHVFHEIEAMLDPGDVLVLNDTRVLPARLYAIKVETGGALEILLLQKLDDHRWRALVGGRGARPGVRLRFGDVIDAEIVEALEESERVVRFDRPIEPYLDQLGEMPLPPYIRSRDSDPERYQTVFNRRDHAGSAAAPTAGLHFTPDLLARIRAKGVRFAMCTLSIGLGTFQPVRADRIEDHVMHREWASLSADDARLINETKLAGGRVIAVGTTAARTLETAGILSEGGDPSRPNEPAEACAWRPVVAFERETGIFITPGYRWRVVDGLITNFHLPKSTLLMMISAFAGRERVLDAYATALREGYRFFSFGDAMFIA